MYVGVFEGIRGACGRAFGGFYESRGCIQGLWGTFKVKGGIWKPKIESFSNSISRSQSLDLDSVLVHKAEHMTLHVAYQDRRMHAEVDILLSQNARTQYRQLRYVDTWGETALSLAMTLGEERDEVIMKLLHMDHWALGVRCKHTGNFPVHVVFQKVFTLQTRILVAVSSECIVCSHNFSGNTALHLALLSGCDDASIAQLTHILGLKTVMLTVFVHENKAKQIPLVMAIRQACGEKTIIKILERTMLAVSHWMEFFAEWKTNVIGDNITMDQSRIFGSVVCADTETNVVFKSSGYLFCGAMIELESTQDCEDSVRNKRSLICHDFASNVNAQCLRQGSGKMHLKMCAGLGKTLSGSILANIKRMNASNTRLPLQQEIDAADCMAALLIQEEEQYNTAKHAKATRTTKTADSKATKAASNAKIIKTANAGSPATVTKLHISPDNPVPPARTAANTAASVAADNTAANTAANTDADTDANTAANTDANTAANTAANTDANTAANTAVNTDADTDADTDANADANADAATAAKTVAKTAAKTDASTNASTNASTAADTDASTTASTDAAASIAPVTTTCKSAKVTKLHNRRVDPVPPANAASSANSSIDNSTATVSTQHRPEPKGTHTEPSKGGISDESDRRECCMCFGENRNTALVPCHHMCLCDACAVQLMLEPEPQCPICRRHVRKTIKLYF